MLWSLLMPSRYSTCVYCPEIPSPSCAETRSHPLWPSCIPISRGLAVVEAKRSAKPITTDHLPGAVRDLARHDQRVVEALMDSTNRSAKAFRFGLSAGNLNTLTPPRFKISRKPAFRTSTCSCRTCPSQTASHAARNYSGSGSIRPVFCAAMGVPKSMVSMHRYTMEAEGNRPLSRSFPPIHFWHNSVG